MPKICSRKWPPRTNPSSSIECSVPTQVSAGIGNEKVLLELAYELEAAQPWVAKKPGVWAS